MISVLKTFSKFKLEELLLLVLVTFGVIFICYAFPAYYSALQAQAQEVQQQQPLSPTITGVKISSPMTGKEVPVGQLTVTGISTDKTTTDCTVYADWNDLQSMQKATPAGPNYSKFGRDDNDYSRWIFTYTDKYHVISEGTNELTAKLSCDIGPFNFTKYDSVNITGVS